MFNILQQPFPSQKNTSHTTRMCCIAAFCVFAVLYFIHPFGLDQAPHKTAAVAAIQYALVTLVLSLLCTMLVPMLFPKAFDEKHWTVLLEMIFLLTMLLIIALGNVWLTNYIFGTSISAALVVNTIKYTLFIGIAPVMLSVLLKQQTLLSKYSREAGQIEQLMVVPTALKQVQTAAIQKESTVAEADIAARSVPDQIQNMQLAVEDKALVPAPGQGSKTLLHLKGNNQSESLQIAAADFLFAAAADNYTSIHYLQDGVSRQLLFRVPVKNLEAQTAPVDSIFRCHKSYLVNLQQVAHISGNAQGYTLHLLSNAFEVPVSRTLNSIIKQKIAALHGIK